MQSCSNLHESSQITRLSFRGVTFSPDLICMNETKPWIHRNCLLDQVHLWLVWWPKGFSVKRLVSWVYINQHLSSAFRAPFRECYRALCLNRKSFQCTGKFALLKIPTMHHKQTGHINALNVPLLEMIYLLKLKKNNLSTSFIYSFLLCFSWHWTPFFVLVSNTLSCHRFAAWLFWLSLDSFYISPAAMKQFILLKMSDMSIDYSCSGKIKRPPKVFRLPVTPVII